MLVDNLLRQQITEYLGIQPQSFFNGFEILNEIKCDGYSQLLIQYKGSEDDVILAYLLLPEGNDICSAVLVHHQHNGERYFGKSEVCGLVGNPLQAFGITLVKRGFIVLAPDSICFEDRRKDMRGTIPDEPNDSNG